MTVCNMTIEGGGRAGMIAPDDDDVRLAARSAACAIDPAWRELQHRRGRDVRHRDRRRRRARSARWSPGARPPRWSSASPTRCPSRRTTATSARWPTWASRPARRSRRSRIDRVFIGSCTNSRIGDLRAAAEVVKGRKVADGVIAMVVPGSEQVRAQAEAGGPRRGLPRRRLRLAQRRLLDVPGHEPRHRARPASACASTSNRNFEGRQGRGARTHLRQPADGRRRRRRGPLRRHPDWS